jgi:hypothetical protein
MIASVSRFVQGAADGFTAFMQRFASRLGTNFDVFFHALRGIASGKRQRH